MYSGPQPKLAQNRRCPTPPSPHTTRDDSPKPKQGDGSRINDVSEREKPRVPEDASLLNESDAKEPDSSGADVDGAEHPVTKAETGVDRDCVSSREPSEEADSIDHNSGGHESGPRTTSPAKEEVILRLDILITKLLTGLGYITIDLLAFILVGLYI